tara:strand:- start:1018 stop:1287 length:270 start_codon:yes stop_codon:yes gene_type:complete
MSNESGMFDPSRLDSILEKAAEDETGNLNAIINDLIILSRKAGEAGMTLQELAHLATLGHFISKDPDLQKFMNFLLTATQPKEGDETVN